jgi:drug/metabolite transporter (DMT)-like permease
VAVPLALLSSLLWGSADFGGGLISRRLPAMAVVGWSQFCALVILAGVVLFGGMRAPDGGWLFWGLLGGLVGATGLVAFYRALATGTMGVVSPVAALGTSLVPVSAGVALGERPAAVQAAGMAVAVLGAVAASGPELSGSARGRSVALAVLSGVMFGMAFVCLDHGAESDPWLTALAMRLTSLALFGTAALATRSLGGVRPRDLPWLAVVGVADVSANLAFALASTQGLVSVVAVLGSLYPVVTVLLARVVLSERLRAIQVVGILAALTGVALVSAG